MSLYLYIYHGHYLFARLYFSQTLLFPEAHIKTGTTSTLKKTAATIIEMTV